MPWCRLDLDSTEIDVQEGFYANYGDAMIQALLLALLSINLFSNLAWSTANFSGHWVANDGKVSSNIGISGNCSKVEVIIEQDATAISTRTYKADCGLWSTNWGPIRQGIREGKVYELDEEVGTIDDTTMLTTSTSGGVLYTYNLKKVTDAQGVESLQTYYGTKNFVGAIVVEATLKRIDKRIDP